MEPESRAELREAWHHCKYQLPMVRAHRFKLEVVVRRDRSRFATSDEANSKALRRPTAGRPRSQLESRCEQQGAYDPRESWRQTARKKRGCQCPSRHARFATSTERTFLPTGQTSPIRSIASQQISTIVSLRSKYEGGKASSPEGKSSRARWAGTFSDRSRDWTRTFQSPIANLAGKAIV